MSKKLLFFTLNTRYLRQRYCRKYAVMTLRVLHFCVLFPKHTVFGWNRSCLIYPHRCRDISSYLVFSRTRKHARFIVRSSINKASNCVIYPCPDHFNRNTIFSNVSNVQDSTTTEHYSFGKKLYTNMDDPLNNQNKGSLCYQCTIVNMHSNDP